MLPDIEWSRLYANYIVICLIRYCFLVCKKLYENL